MPKIKRRIFSGSVCEQEVFAVPERVKNLKLAEPRMRFKDEVERQQHREGIARRHHARQFNANFGPQSLYCTLTLDNAHEVHTFAEARRIRNLYRRRLQSAVPGACFYIYMGRGKGTQRIHLHMVSNGLPEEMIKGKWQMGEVARIEPLRKNNYYGGVNYGQDYTGLANYLFDHWTPEQGGHHYSKTRNSALPESEEPTIAKRTYSLTRPPKAPKGYVLVERKENQFGFLYFKYVKLPEKPNRPPTVKI